MSKRPESARGSRRGRSPKCLADSNPKRPNGAPRPGERAPRPDELLGKDGEAERNDDEAGAGNRDYDQDEAEPQDAETSDRYRDPAELERNASPRPQSLQVARSRIHHRYSATASVLATSGLRHDLNTKVAVVHVGSPSIGSS